MRSGLTILLKTSMMMKLSVNNDFDITFYQKIQKYRALMHLMLFSRSDHSRYLNYSLISEYTRLSKTRDSDSLSLTDHRVSAIIR